MLDRYNAEARRAVALARDEARRLEHPHVGTEHLLLGLLAAGASGDSAAFRSLRGAGVALASCREKVAEALSSRTQSGPGPTSGELPLTDRASRALDRAGKLALRLRSEEVGTAHVLLSVLDVEGTAGQVLRGLSVDLVALRRSATEEGPDGEGAGGGGQPVVAGEDSPATEVTDETGDADAEPAVAPFKVDPVCPACGTPLRASLGHTSLAADSGTEFGIVYCSACGAALGVVAPGA